MEELKVMPTAIKNGVASQQASLGIIVGQSKNPAQVDTWALVTGTSCTNIIVASYNDILAIQNQYDYLVDATAANIIAGIGNTYNPQTNVFIPPPAPPPDYVDNFQATFGGILTNLQVCLSNMQNGNLTPSQISTAYNNILQLNPGLDQPTLTILSNINNYFLGNG
jgi:hypothetical protein